VCQKYPVGTGSIRILVEKGGNLKDFWPVLRLAWLKLRDGCPINKKFEQRTNKLKTANNQ
jgi:hypothetical protein